MNKHNIPKRDELNSVKQIFAELEAVDTLIHQQPREVGSGAIAASDLLAYACGDEVNAGQISGALIRSPALRRVLKGFLTEVSEYYIPEAIAASTEGFPERGVDGCRLRLEVSRAESNQYYLIIELSEGGHIPSLLTLCDLKDRFEQVKLPPPRKGTIQVTVTLESGIPDLLRDPKTAVYLR